ncbi:hypothetical protein DPMN_168242 [Dreissena polymorpha]|uniref:Uncharacterized protein n=1 Tax=Dreissena polymorpha TaxID=45954 RepID=A0A9D4F1E1_DREPO|nr:hypothetical protein DPMN_168242 [Dreissena polymorpha]
MMASQKRIDVDVNQTDRFLVYDALETLVSGERTGKSILRSMDKSDGRTWAFIMQKGDFLIFICCRRENSKEHHILFIIRRQSPDLKAD